MLNKLKPCPFRYEENDLDLWERQGFFIKKPWSVICNFYGKPGGVEQEVFRHQYARIPARL